MLTQQPAVWSLPLGASASRPIRLAGQVFLGLSAAMAIAWAAELCRDSWVQQGHLAIMVLAVLGSLAWCFQVGRLWRAWSAVKPSLRLQWTGDATEQAHWRVMEWGQPVSVRVACDFQDWILLDVKSLPSEGEPARSIWSWMRGRDDATLKSDSSEATAHRFRVLLYQSGELAQGGPSPNRPAPRQPADHQTLASWACTTFPGNNLARLVPFRSSDRHPSRAASGRVQAQPWPATEFQQTQWSPRGEAPEQEDVQTVVWKSGGAP